MKLLLAVDGSPCSEAAVAEVARRPWPAFSEIRLITVDAPLPTNLLRGSSKDAFDEMVAQMRAEAVRRLNAACNILKQTAPHLPVTPLLREGWPRDVILNEAESWGADLIVVGSHGHGVIGRMFLGSVSLALATNAPCSVEIVRSPRPS